MIEVIPAVSLIAAVSMIGLKILLIDMRLQELALRKEIIQLSHNRVFSGGTRQLGGIAVYQLDDKAEWDVMYFPQESWIPGNVKGGNRVMWRTKMIKEQPYTVIMREYSAPGSTEWTWWNSIILVEDDNASAK